MILKITPKDQIYEELQSIDSFLNIVPTENIEEIVNRGNDLTVYMARSGKLLAEAKHHLNSTMKSEVITTLESVAKQTPKATSKAVNALIDSLCKDEQYLVDFCERVNRTCTHQLDWCRTLISKAKEEMRFSPMYNNQR